MVDLWVARDLPVLSYVVEQIDGALGHREVHSDEVAEALGIGVDSVRRSFRTLSEATPPLVVVASDYDDHIGVPYRITERAYRAVGAWPTAEGLTSQIAEAFDYAAETETDPEQKAKLKAMGGWLAGAGRSVAVDVMTRFVERQAGLG
jgi:hypothetical protein